MRRWMASALLAASTFLICFLNLGIGSWHAAQYHHPSSILISPRTSTSIPRAIGAADGVRMTQYQEPKPRPPLESIAQGWNITGDPSWLLNFAIVGFPKCGTSTLMFHLQSHPQVKIFGDERCEMCYNQQVRLVNDLYNDFPPGDYARGIKCPMDLESTKLSGNNYNRFFPGRHSPSAVLCAPVPTTCLLTLELARPDDTAFPMIYHT
jgi:hypothetical protein